MQRWIPILCLVALLLYAGWVLDSQPRFTTGPGSSALMPLQTALERAGGRLEAAAFLLDAPISDPALEDRLRQRLGWHQPTPVGEERELWLETQNAMYALQLRWRMTGERAAAWSKQYGLLAKALADEGILAPLHVQLEGPGPAGDVLALANSGLDSLSASERQPWRGERSASVAGVARALPRGPHEVNIQVAARQTPAGTRLWVAWPALTGDY